MKLTVPELKSQMVTELSGIISCVSSEAKDFAKAKEHLGKALDLGVSYEQATKAGQDSTFVLPGIGGLVSKDTDLGKSFVALKDAVASEQQAAITQALYSLLQSFGGDDTGKNDTDTSGDTNNNTPAGSEEETPSENPEETGSEDNPDEEDPSVEKSFKWPNDLASSFKADKRKEREASEGLKVAQKLSKAAGEKPKKTFSWDNVSKGEYSQQ